jgi:Na+-transporting methylmalonyl-CoA/oxaloacetate decarboxylase gamma subunit
MIQLPTLLAVEAVSKATVSDALPHLMGFVVVLVTLTVLWGLCLLIGAILQKVAAHARPKTIAANASADDSISRETLVVIAAAVAAVTGKPRRIISIQPHHPAWGQAGRQEVLSSHKVR